MSHVVALSQWKKTVSTSFGHLSGPQARGLALWSFGMVLAKSCGITSVVGLLAPLVESSESNLRQQLREWCYDAKDKKGEHRQQIEVSLCFEPLLCWILSWWGVDERRLALAMDASNLSDRFTVLCISVVYRGCAIPVAWKILVENSPGSWEPYWKDLFTLIHSSVPAEWTVIVRASRGLYAKWLYEHLVSLGWHPFLRINVRGKVRPEGEEAFRWLSSLVPLAGRAWAGAVECFVDKPKRLSCTLLACYEAGYADPWLIVTDLPELHVAVRQRKSTQRSRPRLQSCFAHGLQLIFVALLKGEPLPLGRFIPEPWPTVLPPGKKPKAKASKNKGKGKKKKGKNKGTPPASKAAA